MGANRLTGSPWHVETVDYKTTSRCRYYDSFNGGCSKTGDACCGKRNCPAYGGSSSYSKFFTLSKNQQNILAAFYKKKNKTNKKKSKNIKIKK